MLRSIRPEEARLGMFVHGFEGGWLSHPFWRSKFVVEDEAVLDRLRASTVRAIVIDDARGLAPDTGRAERLKARAVAPPPPVQAPTPTPEPAPSAFEPSPGDPRRMIERSKQVVRQLFEDAGQGRLLPVEDVTAVVSDVSRALKRNRGVLLGITRLKTKDEYTYAHSVAVCALMVNLGREMGLADAQLQELGTAGLLHDLGKATIAAAVLNKPGPLTETEALLVRQHPVRGHEMLVSAGNVCATALDVCLHHHERIDGSGYPFGLAGSDISLPVRIAAVCDVYDAMTSVRPYKNALSPPDAVAAMTRIEGHFDAEILGAFMRSVGVFPRGMLVRLASDRLAVVMANGRHTGRPRVRVFHDAAADRPLEPAELILMGEPECDRVVAEADPAAFALGDGWAERRERLAAGR